MKEEILKAIFKVKKTHGPHFEERSVKNIYKIRKMTKNAHLRNLAREVIAVMDTSFFRNGNKGFLITETCFYSLKGEEKESFPFTKIDYAEPSSGGKLILNFTDGSSHKIRCGINKYYIANVIDNIVDIIDENTANAVPKAEITSLNEAPDKKDCSRLEETKKEEKAAAKPSEPKKRVALEEELSVNAFPDLEKAAENGDINAIRRLGEIYLNGIGIEKDSYIAYLWYLKGKDLGDPVSITALGEIYLNGTRKFPEDPYMALKMFEKAADMGYIRAQIRYEAMKDDDDLYF